MCINVNKFGNFIISVLVLFSICESAHFYYDYNKT